jgi:hypothetical protein
MRVSVCATVLSIGLIGAVIPAQAHHAFSAEFDANRPVTLVGTITRMEWVNPHSWITLDVKRPDGTVETWKIEAGSPNALLRRGFNKTMLVAGTEVHVEGFQAKDGLFKANGGKMTLPDGQTLLLTSPGTGSPSDTPNDEKNEKK